MGFDVEIPLRWLREREHREEWSPDGKGFEKYSTSKRAVGRRQISKFPKEVEQFTYLFKKRVHGSNIHLWPRAQRPLLYVLGLTCVGRKLDCDSCLK